MVPVKSDTADLLLDALCLDQGRQSGGDPLQDALALLPFLLEFDFLPISLDLLLGRRLHIPIDVRVSGDQLVTDAVKNIRRIECARL